MFEFFAARNMLHLEIVSCREITEELERAQKEIQDDAHLYLNTTFELIDDYCFEENIEEMFEK